MTSSPSSAPTTTPTTAPRLDVLQGLVERVTFHNEQNGFCVLRVKVRGFRDLVTVVGHTPTVTPGEWVKAHGEWTMDTTHGRQFKAAFLKTFPPNTLQGIEKYLGSGMVKGIGPHFAHKLVAVHGAEIFSVIETKPEKLLEIDGIGKKRVNKIVTGWLDQRIIREIMVFLHGHGVSTSKAVRIYKCYGEEAVKVVTENPYRLAEDIRGIGFKSADTIAQNVGIPRDSILRARAGVAYTLSEASGNQGHCFLARPKLVEATNTLLEIPESTIEQAIDEEIDRGTLTRSAIPVENAIYLSSLLAAEQGAANRLMRLKAGTPPWPAIDAEKALPWVESKLKITLAGSQREAVRTALASKVMVITGGPGVGKTTLVKSILTVLRAKGVQIQLAAPTGRAAKRLSESSGEEAKTLHRLLEVDPATMSFKRTEDHPLECDLLVIDECSMVDITIAYNVLKALPDHAAVIFVGDVDQLPSVGSGAFLGDLIASGAIPVIRLTEVFRQAAASWIIRIAHQINRGVKPTFPQAQDHGDCYFLPIEDRTQTAAKIVDLVQTRLPRAYHVDPIRDIQVLTPMNRGDTGARGLNIALQTALNPPGEASLEKYGQTYSVGDKVMQIENNYDRDVYNGDIGFVKAINREDQEMTVTFDDRDVVYPISELDELVLCYATTIHKSQGSEYPIVVIPVTMQHYMMLKRNLIYTGVTRGKKLVVLVGEEKALMMAVRDWKTQKRNTGLAERLRAFEERSQPLIEQSTP